MISFLILKVNLKHDPQKTAITFGKTCLEAEEIKVSTGFPGATTEASAVKTLTALPGYHGERGLLV